LGGRAGAQISTSPSHYVPTVPDFALDQHTLAGWRKGRGLALSARKARGSCRPAETNAYADEAARLWRIRARRRPKDDERNNAAGRGCF
jgi:hypothetical protein